MRKRYSCLLCWLLLAVSLVPARASERAVLLWQDTLPGGADVASLGAVLRNADIPTEVVSGRDLSAPGRLDIKRVSLLILPYGSRYPAPARDAILAYLRGGGALLTLGGRAFTEPLQPAGDGWATAEALRQPLPGDPLVVADFEPNGASPEATTASDRSDMPVIRTVTEKGGHVLEAHSPSLTGFEYVLLRVHPARADRPILRFRARGDGATPFLCVEAGEADGSRWKAIVPLTKKWETYRIHATEFVAYASPSRMGEGDSFHPEALRELRFGYTQAMVGTGAHRFWIDDIVWEPGVTVARAGKALPLVRTAASPVEVFFGSHLTGGTGVMPLFSLSTRIPDGARLVPVHPLAPPVPQRPARGWTATGWADDLFTAWLDNPGGRLSVARQSTGRRETLVEARAAGGKVVGPAFSLIVQTRGEFAGGRWAFSGIESPDLYSARDAASGAALVRLVHALTSRPLLGELRPEFSAGETGATLQIAAEVAGIPGSDSTATVRTRVFSLGEAAPLAEATASAQVPAGKRALVKGVTVPLARLNPGAYRLEASILVDGEEIDRATCTVDLAQTLRMLADEFCQRQRENGTYSGVAFNDARAARTLLAMHALTGDRRYLASARRWGEEVLRQQREDGGYRMGYGITSVGEECYVADGGEIATGIIRLALDLPARERGRYLKSLEQYIRFREDFRCEGGGIGVGYCKTDYGVRPMVPLKEIRRIYAPEINLYTIGCTLATAAAHATLFGGLEEQQRAAGDARWLMERQKNTIHGAYVESFIWAHALLPDKALRAEIEAFLRERMIQPLCGPDRPWWIWGAGRSALTLDGFIYAANTFAPEPAVQAEAARAIYGLCADSTPWSLHRLRAEPKWNHHDWIYASYAGVSLADALRPGITLPPTGK